MILAYRNESTSIWSSRSSLLAYQWYHRNHLHPGHCEVQIYMKQFSSEHVAYIFVSQNHK